MGLPRWLQPLAIGLSVLVGCTTGDAGSTSVPILESIWGPLAVANGWNGDAARNEGILAITESCVFLRTPNGGNILLTWPAERTGWEPATGLIHYVNSGNRGITLANGQRVVVGGSGGTTLPANVTWVSPPNPACLVAEYWWLGDISAL